jgi:hypothetical protein
MLINRADDIKSSEINDKRTSLNRRELMVPTALVPGAEKR